ncbi:magnesium transporter [Corynebacterium sp. BCW_4722]|nr:magnesium transporter [Corynebacterium sp. BCW_4722]
MQLTNEEAIIELERHLNRRNVESDDLTEIQELLEDTPMRDVIHLVERQPSKRGAVLVRLLPPERAAHAFDALDPAHQAEIVAALGDGDVSGLFDELGTEDRVALLDNLPAEIADRFMHDLDEEERANTNAILGYEKGSVGRAMSPDVAVVTGDMGVQDVVDKLRADADSLETIYTIPVVDDDRVLTGVVGLKDLFKAHAGQTVDEVMGETSWAQATDDAEDTARWLLSSGLLALPIVDDDHRLVGIFTYDEAQDIVEDADSEDHARQGGSEALRKPYLSTPVMQLVRSRIVWLLVLAVSAILTVQVLGLFEDALAEVTVLSLFIPLLTGTGGNTGNQAATTVTRALALNDVRKRDVLQVMWRELRVGMTLGAVLGVLGLALAWVVFGREIGIIIGATLFCICAMSATVGGMMPIIAKTVGADPAVFSNPFISTFCDATGLIIYFMIAKAVLGL